MDYNQISNFLDKFKKLIFQKEVVKEVVLKIIVDEIKYELPTDRLTIKNNIILIEGSPMLKSEVLMHKKQILEKIKVELPNINFTNIR